MPRQNSAGKIYAYSLMTLGLYFLYWCARSRREINQAARQNLIPSPWLLVVPAANDWWMWKYAHALEHVSYGRVPYADTFLLYIIATLVPLSPLSFFDIFSDGQTVGISTWTMVVIVAIILILMMSIGLAFFCSQVQQRINDARAGHSGNSAH
jgi:hypothetical protein